MYTFFVENIEIAKINIPENIEFAKISTRIFILNTEFAKINTRKMRSKCHSQKFIHAKYYTNKVLWIVVKIGIKINFVCLNLILIILNRMVC